MLTQVILLIFIALELGLVMAMHGQKRTDKYNFWSQLGAWTFICTLLYFGGFWNVFL